MKSRKNRIKRSGGTSVGIGYSEYEPKLRFSVSDLIDRGWQDSGPGRMSLGFSVAVNVNQENLENQEKARKPKKDAVPTKAVKRNAPNTAAVKPVVQEKA